MDGNEYATIIARNIFSGKNACGTLQSAVESNDYKYFTNAAKPVVDTLLGQIAQSDSMVAKLSAKNEKLRYALEIIVQNLTRPNEQADFRTVRLVKVITDAVDNALERNVSWQ